MSKSKIFKGDTQECLEKLSEWIQETQDTMNENTQFTVDWVQGLEKRIKVLENKLADIAWGRKMGM